MDVRPIPAFTPGFTGTCELCVNRVYDDAQPKMVLRPGDKVRGTLTGGYGHTSPELHIGMAVDKAQADAWLKADLEVAAQRIAHKLSRPAIDRLSEHQYAALLDFVFNTGTPGSSLWKIIEAGKLGQVPAQFRLFTHVHVGGQLVELRGLKNRREAEIRLWNTADETAKATPALAAARAAQVAVAEQAPTSSITRLADTPPVPAPLVQKKSFLASMSAVALGAWQFISDPAALIGHAQAGVRWLLGQAQPYSDNERIGALVSTLTLALFGLGVAAAAWGIIHQQRVKAEPGDGAKSGEG